MFVMVGGRQSGKSTTCMRWLMEQPNSRVVITSDEQRRRHLVHVGNQLAPGLSRRFWEDRILVVGDLWRGSLRGRTREVGIDDAEEVLRALLGAEVGLAAFNATLIPQFPTGTPTRDDYVDGEYREDATTEVEGRKQIEQRHKFTGIDHICRSGDYNC